MVNQHTTIDDEQRRDVLKALGITGAIAAGGVTLEEAQEAMSAEASEELAPVGQAIQAELGGNLDAGLIAGQQAALTEAASALPAAAEQGLPEDEPREDFERIASAGWPVYEHLTEVGFFESTTEHLPEFTPETLTESVRTFVGSEALARPLEGMDFTDEKGVDLVSTVVANAQQLSDHHWVATEEIPRAQIEFGEAIPPMTMGAAGGVLLWLDDLDLHLWQNEVLLTEDILADATWYGQSMAAGFQLMSEGARVIAEDSGALSDSELGALLSTGFAVQAISQGLLPQDVYWVTEEMRDPSRNGLKESLR